MQIRISFHPGTKKPLVTEVSKMAMLMFFFFPKTSGPSLHFRGGISVGTSALMALLI